MVARQHWKLVLTVLILAELAGALESSLMFSALPTALKAYHNSANVGWLITGYFLVGACAAAICGRLGDIFGRSRMLMIVLGIATAGSLVSLFSDSLGMIIFGRSIQGFAGAVLPLCYGLVRETLPRERLALGIGAITASGAIGAAIGFILGGIVVDSFHWQHIFTCSGLIASAALVMCHFMLPRSVPSRSGGRLDIMGGVLFAPGLAAILWAISNAKQTGWLSPSFALWTAGGLLVLAVWVWHELRQDDPLIDVRLLAHPNIAIANLTVVFGTLGAVQVLQIFPILLQQPAWTGVGFGLSATLVGFLKLPSNIASIAGSSLGGAISDHVGNKPIVILAAALCLVGWGGLMLNHSVLWLTIALICLSSAGSTMLLAGAVATIVQLVPHERTSEATGITIVARTICQGIGGQIVIVLLAGSSVHAAASNDAFPSPAAYNHVFLYIVAMCTCALGASLLLKSDRAQPSATSSLPV